MAGNKRRQMIAGLELCRAFMAKHGITSVPRPVIALWCGCSASNIEQIELRALKKIRRYGVFKQADLDYHCRLAADYYRIEL